MRGKPNTCDLCPLPPQLPKAEGRRVCSRSGMAKDQRPRRFVWNDPCCASPLPVSPQQGRAGTRAQHDKERPPWRLEPGGRSVVRRPRPGGVTGPQTRFLNHLRSGPAHVENGSGDVVSRLNSPSVYENRFLAQMRVVIVGPSGNAPPLKGGCLQSDSCSRWVCELSGDHRGSPGRMSVVDREIGPRRRGRGSVRLAFGSHFLLEPTSLLDVYDDDNCTVYRSAPALLSPSWREELWPVKGPLAAKASRAKRSPMRWWVVASGWSWSDSGSSARSASPYSSRPSR